MKVRAQNIRPFAANGHFSLYYRSFFSLSSYHICIKKALDTMPERFLSPQIVHTPNLAVNRYSLNFSLQSPTPSVNNGFPA